MLLDGNGRNYGVLQKSCCEIIAETPLTVATSLAEPRQMIMSLYSGGAHLDFRSRDSLTPMHKSCLLGNDVALKCLLELGAFAEVADARGLTPLYVAVVHAASLASVEYLLFNGSPVDTRDESQWTELHHACKLGLAQHVDHLIYYGADVNAQNSVGNTPLHVCAVHGKLECARVLLFRGCERWLRNLSNQTPFDSAVIAANQDVAELIRAYRDVDTQVIKEKPFYNTKRRSVYLAASNERSILKISSNNNKYFF